MGLYERPGDPLLRKWDWYPTSPSVHWKSPHNFIHHKYPNVFGLYDDIGYDHAADPRSTLESVYFANPVTRVPHSCSSGVTPAAHGPGATKYASGDNRFTRSIETIMDHARVVTQVGKDYIVFCLTGRNCSTRLAPCGGNLIRNYWSTWWSSAGTPDGAESSLAKSRELEPRRSGTCTDVGGRLTSTPGACDGVHWVVNFATRSNTILFPALPSNRYAKSASLCGRCAISMTCRTLLIPLRQYAQSVSDDPQARVPDQTPQATSDDRPRRTQSSIPRPRRSAREFRCRPGHRKRSGLKPAPRCANSMAEPWPPR